MSQVASERNSSIKPAKSPKTSEFSDKLSKVSKGSSINNALLKKTRYFYKTLNVDSLEEASKMGYFMKREYNESTGELEYK